MYARVSRWEDNTPEELRRAAEMIDTSSGPPEGVPATGFMLLVDPESGRSMGIALFDSEEDMRKGDEALNAMNPPAGQSGRRVAVEMYEVAVDVKA